jgi:predicted nucleic acid-binding protein
MPRAPVFLDSNVFLYAAGREHPLREPCRRALDRVAAGSVAAVTSSEVVREILHVLARRELRKEAVQLSRWVLDLVPDVLPVRREDVALACELLERRKRLNARDAIHLATMRLNGITEIVTADHHFTAIEGVRRIDPSSWVLA